jgi:hypothetical protein
MRVFFLMGLALHVRVNFCLHWSARLFCVAPLVFSLALESLAFFACALFFSVLTLRWFCSKFGTSRVLQPVNAAERFG